MHVILDLKICKEDHFYVRCEEDEDMPSTVEVVKANTGRPGAEDSFIDPADDRQHPQENGSLAQAEHLDILLHFQLMHE